MIIKKFNEATSTPNKKLIVKKGYTLSVVSWENDGDNYNTKIKTVETVEEAEALYKLMQLCRSKNRGDRNCLGNTTDDNFSIGQKETLANFFRENPAALKEFFKYNPNLDVDDIDDDTYTEYFDEIKGDLLGYSEYYLCRVMESCTVTYSPDDIYLDIITF